MSTASVSQPPQKKPSPSIYKPVSNPKHKLQGLDKSVKNEILSYLKPTDVKVVGWWGGRWGEHPNLVPTYGVKDTKEQIRRQTRDARGNYPRRSVAQNKQESTRKYVMRNLKDVQLAEWLFDDTGKDVEDIPLYTLPHFEDNQQL